MTLQTSTDDAAQFGDLPDAPPKKRIRLSLSSKVCAGFLLGFVFLMIFGPMISPYDQAYFIEETLTGEFILDPGFRPPNEQAWLGTDYLGRDTLSRLIYGARTTIGISLAATMLAYLIGITLGIGAAVAGGWTASILCRADDAVLAFPSIMLALVMIAAIGSSIPLLIVLGGVVYAAAVFRIARALALDIMVQDFVEAARARGEGQWWIITREVLPNAIMPLATDFGLRLVFVILFVTSLSFLGLGVRPPLAEWGTMMRENMTGLGNGFWNGGIACLAPAAAIAILTISINLIVDDISAQSGGALAEKMT